MKHTTIYWLIVLLFLICCNFNKTHQRLTNFRTEFIFTPENLLENEATYTQLACSKLNPRTDTIKYLTGKIYVSCLRVLTGCSKFRGDIEIEKDTIKLLTDNISNEVCSEQDCYRTIYEISNKENRKYVFEKY